MRLIRPFILTHDWSAMGTPGTVCVCVCVSVSERERESKREISWHADNGVKSSKRMR